MQIRQKIKIITTIFASAVLLFTTISCENPTNSKGNSEDPLIFPENVGYGPYTSSDGFLTVTSTDEGIKISKINPSGAVNIRIDIRKKDSDITLLRRCFDKNSDYTSKDINNFTLPYVEKNGIYAFRLITWDKDWNNYQSTKWVYVKAKGGIGDIGYNITSPISYNASTKTFTIKKTDLLNNFNIDNYRLLKPYYHINVYYPNGSIENIQINNHTQSNDTFSFIISDELSEKISRFNYVDIQLECTLFYYVGNVEKLYFYDEDLDLLTWNYYNSETQTLVSYIKNQETYQSELVYQTIYK